MSTLKKIPGIVTGSASLQRPKFSPGLLLEDEDLTLAVDSMRRLTQALFSAFFGCGVICGFVVKWEIDCGKLKITVGKGAALDCTGALIQMPEPTVITLDPTCGPKIPPNLCIAIRHHESCCGPRDVTCAPEDEQSGSVCTRIREGYELRIAEDCPDCSCGCAELTDEEKQQEDTSQSIQNNPNAPNPAPSVRSVTPVDSYGLKCYEDHYKGECGCACCCDWIVLATLKVYIQADEVTGATVDHSRRRFIRPVLMRDPIAYGHPSP